MIFASPGIRVAGHENEGYLVKETREKYFKAFLFSVCFAYFAGNIFLIMTEHKSVKTLMIYDKESDNLENDAVHILSYDSEK